MLSFDQVCDPVSMFQDNFSLSEFILGPLEEEASEKIGTMLKTGQNMKNEVLMDEEFQVTTTDIYQGAQTPQYSPCSYQYQQLEPGSPSCSSSSEHSAASPTPAGFQGLCTYNGLSNRNARQIPNSVPYLTHVGYPGRKPRIRDDELPLEEREKRRIRRERNKQAALRCRTRRRERIEVLEKETDDLESQNSEVRSEISCLQAHLKQLEQMLKEHQCNM